MEELKKRAASLIPYRKIGDSFFVFLQRRTTDAPSWPDYLGFFGGKIEEGEKMEEAFLREVKEELNYIPQRAVFWGTFDFGDKFVSIFIEQVDELFENKVEVLEGQYGRFYTNADIQNEKKMSLAHRKVLAQLFSFIAKQN